MSKTVLIVEQAGNPELFVGDERVLVDSGLWDAWFIEHGSIVGRTWVRRDISSDRGLNTEFLSRPVNFSNLGQVFALHSNGAHVSLCDGSVHFLLSDTSPEVVEKLIGRADGR